jgi:hypothetical protein
MTIRSWRDALARLPVILLGCTGIWAVLACTPATRGAPTKRVILIGIDGGTLPRVQELARQGRLPNFSRILSEGASGHLASIYADLPFSPRRGGGYWSPLIWTSIATGKEPVAHGIIDFRLPDPEIYRICTLPGAAQAEVSIAPAAEAVKVRLLRPADAGSSLWSVRLESTAAPAAIPAGGSLEIVLPAGNARQDLRLRFASAASPVEPLCLHPPEFLDANGNLAATMDLVTHRHSFASGWTEPRVGKLRGVGNDYRRVKAIWNILSERGEKVAVIGWRDSWPAEEVNGYFISDRLGWRPAGPAVEKAPLGRLAFPASLEQSLRPLLEAVPEADARADRSVLSVAPCELDEQRRRMGRIGYSGDWLRHAAALQALERDPSIRFLAVYYSGIDVLGHLFMGGPRVGDLKCGIGPALVDRYYEVVDGYLGEWLQRIDRDSTLVVVSDHGMSLGRIVGEHSDDGFVMLLGKDVRRGTTIVGAGVLDVTPTLLALLGAPQARDMKGKPVSGLEVSRRGTTGESSVASYERGARPLHVEQPSVEDEEELKERLKALGYIN